MNGYLTLACSVVVGVVFASSAASKLRSASSLEGFIDGVGELTGSPPSRAWWLGRVVIADELLIAVLTGLPQAGAIGPLLADLTTAAFTAAIIRVTAARTGATSSCHCFVTSRGPVGWRHVVRNLLLMAVATCAAAGRAGSRALAPGARPLEAAVAVSAALVVGAIVLFWDDLASVLVDIGDPSAGAPSSHRPEERS